MVSYKAMYDKSVEKQDYETLTMAMKKWEAENDMLIGRLEQIEEFDSGDFDSKCKKYVFDTDDGKTSCVLGAIGDRVLAADENIGKIFAITFKGKSETKKGNRVNNFVIVKIPGGKN